MKILCAADVSISEVIGGAERVLFEQAVRLAKRGHTVHVLTRRLPQHARDHEDIGDVREWRYEVDAGNAPAFIRSTLFNCGRQFEALQREFRYDALVFHQPFTAFAVIRSALSRALPKIYICHSLAFEEYASRNPAEPGIFNRLIRSGNIAARLWLERLALKASDPIVVLSRFTREKLRDRHHIDPEPVRIIPGGADLDRFYPVGNRQDIRNRLGIPPGRIVLLTVRNLVARMGLENLVRAMSAVTARVPDALLVIGGKGPLREELADLGRKGGVEPNVRFAGFIPESDLPDYYRMADLFILPTRELEGFGLVTVEALACGTPVLGTPVGGTLEILKELNPDFLFRDTTPEAISEKIIGTCLQIKGDSRFLENLSARCRYFVEERYSWERNVGELEAVLREAAEKVGT